MREIKFRAKRKDTREWYYFTLEDFQDSGLSSYYSDALDFSMFDKETLGQYIFKDKNGKEIYEGDIVYFGGGYGIVYYDEGKAAFYIEWFKQGKYTDMECIIKYAEVIGNKWENPELLEEEK